MYTPLSALMLSLPGLLQPDVRHEWAGKDQVIGVEFYRFGTQCATWSPYASASGVLPSQRLALQLHFHCTLPLEK